MQRLTVLTGNFGSGKTEIALALAQRCAAQGERVKLVDLDVVNPYFTASGHREAMERQGIEIIAPAFAGTGVDVPALTGSVRAAFVDQQARLLFDLGGDPVGATVVSSLLPLIQRAGGGFAAAVVGQRVVEHVYHLLHIPSVLGRWGGGWTRPAAPGK